MNSVDFINLFFAINILENNNFVNLKELYEFIEFCHTEGLFQKLLDNVKLKYQIDNNEEIIICDEINYYLLNALQNKLIFITDDGIFLDNNNIQFLLHRPIEHDNFVRMTEFVRKFHEYNDYLTL